MTSGLPRFQRSLAVSAARLCRLVAVSLCLFGALSPVAVNAQSQYDVGYTEGARHAAKGYSFFQQNKFSEAEQEYREAVKHSPSTMDFHVGLLAALSKQGQGRWDELAKEYKRILELDPNKTELLGDYGELLYKLKRYDEAVATLRRSLEFNASNPSLHRRLADVLVDQGKAGEAINEYREAIKLSPGDASLHYLLGCLLWRVGQPGDALEAYRKAAELKPDEAAYQGALGYALFNAKDYDGAIEAYKKAVRLNVNDPALQQGLQGAQQQKEYLIQLAAQKAKQEAERNAQEQAEDKANRPAAKHHH